MYLLFVHFFSENLPWTIAEFKCLFQGAHHVSIDSPEENQFVHELSRWSEIWTGAAFFGKDQHYVNSDGSRYGNFENWKDGRKPPMNRARRCIKMDGNGEWFQSCCKKKTFTICEKVCYTSTRIHILNLTFSRKPPTLQAPTLDPTTP